MNVLQPSAAEHILKSLPIVCTMDPVRWYKRVKPFVMGDNYYVKTFYGLPNPPENVLKSVSVRKGFIEREGGLFREHHAFPVRVVLHIPVLYGMQ